MFYYLVLLKVACLGDNLVSLNVGKSLSELNFQFELTSLFITMSIIYLKHLTILIDLVGWSTSSLRRKKELPKVFLKLLTGAFLVSGVNLT